MQNNAIQYSFNSKSDNIENEKNIEYNNTEIGNEKIIAERGNENGNKFGIRPKQSIDSGRRNKTVQDGIVETISGQERRWTYDGGGSSGTTEMGNNKENWNDRGAIRSTKKVFRVNNEEVITYGTTPNLNAQEVYNIVKSAKENNLHGAFVDVKSAEDYSKVKNYTLEDGLGNVTVTEDGDIVSVVKNSNSNIKGI